MKNGKSKEMVAAVEVITPKLAVEYLATSIGNRKFRKRRLEKYCDDRREGRWRLNHQGIAFDTDGKLADGHHRLKMVIETGLPTRMFVVRNVPKEGRIEMDQMLPRSVGDAMRMAEQGDYGHALIATARHYLVWPWYAEFSKCAPGAQAIQDILNEYSDGLLFACERLKTGKSGLTKAVRAVTARAYYHVDRDRLAEWCSVMGDGIPEDPSADSAALVFRNFLIRNIGMSGQALEADRYRKGATSVLTFMRRDKVTKVYGNREDLFPVTGSHACTE